MTREVPEHGTTARWRRGCKCDVCKAAINAYNKAYREANPKPKKTRSQPEHGTRRRYNAGCRCEGCREVVNENARKWRAENPEKANKPRVRPNRAKPKTVEAPLTKAQEREYIRIALAAEREEEKARKAAERERKRAEIIHGTSTAWKSRKCECDVCLAAKKAAYKESARQQGLMKAYRAAEAARKAGLE